MARRTWRDDFVYGAGTFGTAASATTPWRVTDTSAAGTPTYQAGVDNGTAAGIGHFARLGFSNTNEVQNVCLSFGDVLMFNIDDELVVDGRIRLGQSALDTATSIVWGLAGDRNDVLDDVAQNLWFRMEGGTSTTAVYYESDDGTTDTNDTATNLTLTTGWKNWRIDARDKSATRMFFTDATGTMIPMGTTLNMSAYAGCLQPIVQIQKTADTTTDYVDLDSFQVTWSESA